MRRTHARCEQISHLGQRVERAQELEAELGKGRDDHALCTQLADDLRSERFQAFLLEETFRQLVDGASERLWNLSSRYRLALHEEAIYVVDYDNGRQLRGAQTLSGGETFMASLALALELSQQVQRAAGAVALDSLFIDEGFGTLDPESLDAATSAIENLPVGGRMVGMVTHIEELSERLPARIRVEKRAAGSQVRIEAN